MEKPQAFVEPVSLFLSELAEIKGRLENLADSHPALIETVREQTTFQIQQRSDRELQEATRVVRAEFEDRVRSLTADWAMERQSLLDELAALRSSSDPRKILAEIVQTEAALAQVRTSIELLVKEPTVEVLKLVRISTRETELQAYLKGLNFKLEPSTPAAPPSTQIIEETAYALASSTTKAL
jgi:hypothetical protein